jgi:GAF domain-containing protein
VQESGATRTSQATISAALAAANAMARANLGFDPLGSEGRFAVEGGGHSVAEMAYRDLDATLQLLADRAQYITGSTGAAIALRRLGKNDMLCRASSGVNAPELGALLSTEFGLSGESVRTRQALRCDDAERDARVNREVCRQMGIASVVVMPVVHDDEVLGVFELFSGRVNAFGERDLSALQRLSGMVETAIELAHAAVAAPERFKSSASAPQTGLQENPPVAGRDSILEDDAILEVDGFEVVAANGPEDQVAEAVPEVRAEARAVRQIDAPAVTAAAGVLQPASDLTSGLISQPSSNPSSQPSSNPMAQTEVAVPVMPAAARKPIFWSAAGAGASASEPMEADQSRVPVGLRNLRKCEACGFPVSASRSLCVECEEKKWRGQLRRPQASVSQAPVRQAQASQSHVSPAHGSLSEISEAENRQKTPLQKSSAAAATAAGITMRPAAGLAGTSGSRVAAPETPAQGSVLSGTLAGLSIPPAETSSHPTRAFAAAARASAPVFSGRETAGSSPALSAGSVADPAAGPAVSPSASIGIAPITRIEIREQGEAGVTMQVGSAAATEAGLQPAAAASGLVVEAGLSDVLKASVGPSTAAVSTVGESAATVSEHSQRLSAPAPAPAPELVLSAGLAPAQSWFGANKYILAALLVVGAAVAAVVLR